LLTAYTVDSSTPSSHARPASPSSCWTIDSMTARSGQCSRNGPHYLLLPIV
jgi:hypothetical protein